MGKGKEREDREREKQWMRDCRGGREKKKVLQAERDSFCECNSLLLSSSGEHFKQREQGEGRERRERGRERERKRGENERQNRREKGCDGTVILSVCVRAN